MGCCGVGLGDSCLGTIEQSPWWPACHLDKETAPFMVDIIEPKPAKRVKTASGDNLQWIKTAGVEAILDDSIDL